MMISLPVEKAWQGFCEHFSELQRQGRTIAESDDGRYRVILSAESTYANLMVFEDDEIVYDEVFNKKDKFEEELEYLYKCYITDYDEDDLGNEDDGDEDEDEEDDYDGLNEPVFLTPSQGQTRYDVGAIIEDLMFAMSPGISFNDPYFEDARELIRSSAEENLMELGFPVSIYE